ncbi:MAG: fumarate reductase subunit D [Desulfovibrio sp.]|jgi:fumarate reductase subunit D|nr:fumarate reductase subunit D [Desulfovibrio sp.]
MDEKRTCEPIFWALFGAGGMLTAICAPIFILVLLLIPAFVGSGEPAFINCSLLGRLFLFVFISLSAWCGLHRIVHTLHDLRIHWSLAPLVCYGSALLITLLAFAGALIRC